MRMTLRQLGRYLSHIPTIVARETMMDSVVEMMPHIEDEARSQLMRKLSLAADGQPMPETMKEAWAGERESFEDFKKTTIKERIA